MGALQGAGKCSVDIVVIRTSLEEGAMTWSKLKVHMLDPCSFGTTKRNLHPPAIGSLEVVNKQIGRVIASQSRTRLKVGNTKNKTFQKR